MLLPEEQVKEWFTKKLNEKFMFGDAATLVGDKALKRILSPMKLQTMEAYSKLRKFLWQEFLEGYEAMGEAEESFYKLSRPSTPRNDGWD